MAKENCNDTFPAFYSVGLDELSDYDIEKINEYDCIWIVYAYEYGAWDGWGKLYMWDGNRLFEADLGHCSCYGPHENIGDYTKLDSYSREDILSPDLHDCPIEEPCLSKIRELLGV